ncbi:branched-chain amino acid ABC transporter permease [Arthrobacter sp. JZ12]|uniref:branched-chain amino acid ABC transporter permease n=1 Tax=Arthrobacter sp. JZ12 TaxID=2654190 RepID=UPI003085A7F3|nr:branched-chain amino acid ABC transporter permease [Arthrobacter sp. JZ12]
MCAPAAGATAYSAASTSNGTVPTSVQAGEFQNRISGVLRGADGPLADVRISVTGEGFEGETTSNENGGWSIDVPEQGSYEVELDESTLPEGVELAEGQQNPRTVTFAGTTNVTTLFLFGEGIVAGTNSFFNILVDRAVAGLSFGLLLALSAVGLSLIFGTTGLTNFAHGEMVTIGAVLAFAFAGMGLPIFVAIVLAVIGGAALGYMQDAGLWKPLRKRGSGLVPMMIVSIGLALALRYIIQFNFGGATEQLPGAQGRVLEFGVVSITQNNLNSLITSLIIILVIAFLLLRTRIGKATRAVADNPALAAASGIDVDRVIRLVWVVGGALAALGGILWAYYRPGVTFNMGQQILLLIFAGVTLGGLGTVFGALLGSIIVGLFVEVSTIWLQADLKYVGALLIMILVLLFRPQGILGRRERIG